MADLIGVGLALAVAVFARIVGLDRDRAFYPVVLIVVASYYVLFAVMAGNDAELRSELLVFALFLVLAVLGFRASAWFAVAGLALHGVFDFFHHSFLAGSGVPPWWPPFCLAYDLTAAAWLASMLLITKRRHPGEAAIPISG